MNVSTVAELVSTVAVVTGLIFAAVQLRQFRIRQEREAAQQLVRSFQTTDFAWAMVRVFEMPGGLSKVQIEEHLGDDLRIVYALITTWESIGVLVYRNQLSLDVVDDFFSGPILVSWDKLRPLMEGQRDLLNRETIGEWFQWLAERMRDRESLHPPVPAHLAFKDWKSR